MEPKNKLYTTSEPLGSLKAVPSYTAASGLEGGSSSHCNFDRRVRKKLWPKGVSIKDRKEEES